MSNHDLLEKAAFDMFVYQYTKVGWGIDWCEEVFETNYADLKTEYIELAKICQLHTTRKPLSDSELPTNNPKINTYGEKLAFHAGIKWAEHQHGIRS